jgi:preprotein translocase subunit SecE
LEFMSTEETKQNNKALNTVLWLLVVAIIAGVAVLNSIYAEESLFYRVLGGTGMAIVAGFIAVQTSQGAAFWHIAKGARAEVRRVVWPTQDERNKATLMVIAVVAFMALILTFLDWLFGLGAEALLG